MCDVLSSGVILPEYFAEWKGKKALGCSYQQHRAKSQPKTFKKNNIWAASVCVIVLQKKIKNYIIFNQWFLWIHLGEAKQYADAFTAQATHIHILWGFSVPAHWRWWRWGQVLPYCRNFSDAALPAQAQSTRHNPAKQNPVRWSKNMNMMSFIRMA